MKPKLLPSRHELGRLGERMAVAYLKKHGLRILTCNFRIRYGEIDCIAIDPRDQCTVFVEIKTRSGTEFGQPEDAVTPRKLQEVVKTAEYYMLEHPDVPQRMRIDVISVMVTGNGKAPDIRHLRNVTG